MNTSEISHKEEVVNVMGFENFHGLLIQNRSDGILWGNMFFNSKEELKQHIKKVCDSVSNNLRNKKVG